MQDNSEIAQIKQRYEKRKLGSISERYNPLLPSVYMPHQELERILIRKIIVPKLAPLKDRKLIEIGCGDGAKILNFINLGFQPCNIVGIDLLSDRIENARSRLPEAVTLTIGDGTSLQFDENFDVVCASTVFSSILDEVVQCSLARTMWKMVRPGGGVLWYDFTFDNPSNSDVRGVKKDTVVKLFPDGDSSFFRATLAPPISRWVTRIHPQMYNLMNCMPFFRTHLLGWIQKTN